MDLHRPRRAGYRVRAFLILVAVMLLTVGGVTVALDRVCYHYLSQRLPIYPGAEMRVRTHNFLSELGMGNTVITLYAPDPPDEVRAWYAVQTGSLLREWARTRPILYNIAQSSVDVSRADDGVGSLVILFGTCAN
ncbi:MAG: hypothetical protein JNL42_13640 [Anaerolineae bacterium]|nr:hypothetical protein [Anaerolineae bacterium]